MPREQNPLPDGYEVVLSETGDLSGIITDSYESFLDRRRIMGGEASQDISSCRCGEECTPDNIDFEWRDEKIWCESCFDEEYFPCPSCGVIKIRRTALKWRRDNGSTELVCTHCTIGAIRNQCRSCGMFVVHSSPQWTNGRGGRCQYCENNHPERRSSEEIDFHPPEFLGELREGPLGDIVKSDRAIGVELELESSKRSLSAKACSEIDYCIGIGTDSSIAGSGLEFRFPPASGAKLEDLVKRTCTTLAKGKLKPNPSCGFHIHLDMEDVKELPAQRQVNALKNLWMLYLCYEDTIASFLPASRQNNKYCKALRTEYSIDEVFHCRNWDDLERMWYRVRTTKDVLEAKGDHPSSYSSNPRHSRYRGINFHPFFTEGHMEIRYHTGTLRPEKILEWANLHATFVDTAIGMQHDPDRMSEYCKETMGMEKGDKTSQFFSLINLAPSSCGYFLARQEMFKVIPKPFSKDASFESGMKILAEEKEI